MAAPIVLVVDDDKLTRFSVSKILGRAGYRVREAASAADGLAAIQAERPSVVVLDIRLPDRDGFTVLQEIRTSHPQLPVIMMTAHHSVDAANRATAMGACAYFVKPCDPVELQSAVSAALKGSRESGTPGTA